MTRLGQVKTNFTAGEIATELLGRGDLRAYDNGAGRLRNVFILPTGGVRRRAGLAHVGALAGEARLVAFEFNTDQAYLLAFGHQRLDVFRDGVWQTSVTTPWTAAQLGQINWTQSADTLLVVHPDVEPRRITRTGHASWSIAPWSFVAETNAIRQPYHKFAGAEVMLTPSATTGSITLAASSPVFVAGHVGTRFRIAAKQVTITAVSSPTLANASVNETLVSTAGTSDWEEQSFSAVRGWPGAVTFHQDRLVIGGSRELPNRLWLSKSSDLFNFDLGTGLDDESIEFAILSDQVNAIRHVFSGRHLQVFTSGAEWMVTGDPLTPTNLQLSRQTRVGSPIDRSVAPQDVDGATIFVGRHGTDIREFLFADVEQAYQAVDLAVLAHHLVDRPLALAYDARRRLLHCLNADGTLATLTIYRAEKVTAWTRQDTPGLFRSIAVVDDDVYVLVQREAAWQIERFDDALAVDSGVQATSPTPVATWGGLAHLNGRTLKVLADGQHVADAIATAGMITLAEPASAIQAGLGYTLAIEPLPPQGPGGESASALRLVEASFRVHETRALRVDLGAGFVDVPFRTFGDAPILDATQAPFTGDKRLRATGWRRRGVEALWRIESDAPLACAVLSVSTDMKASD